MALVEHGEDVGAQPSHAPEGSDQGAAEVVLGEPADVGVELLHRGLVQSPDPALGLALAGAVSAAYQVLSERADTRPFPAPGRFITVRGRKIHVRVEGEGGPTIVMLPGMTDNGLNWARVWRQLVPAHRAWMYDHDLVGPASSGPNAADAHPGHGLHRP
ncbi:alpha/beta fold hydrolase [Nonomuraea sp. NPDC059023]|uniref:alpha/beta fold hydrolase n=1 Tax=unclassified Nonomuraea TaxID=2593643 RepID=UPI00367A47AE